MKKILLIILFCFFVCGCFNKYDGYQVSELIPNDGPFSLSTSNYVEGTLKNVSNKTCKEVRINFTFSNGGIKDTGWIVVKSPEIDNYIGFNEFAYGAHDITDWKNYKVTVDSVECWDLDF